MELKADVGGYLKASALGDLISKKKTWTFKSWNLADFSYERKEKFSGSKPLTPDLFTPKKDDFNAVLDSKNVEGATWEEGEIDWSKITEKTKLLP